MGLLILAYGGGYGGVTIPQMSHILAHIYIFSLWEHYGIARKYFVGIAPHISLAGPNVNS